MRVKIKARTNPDKLFMNCYRRMLKRPALKSSGINISVFQEMPNILNGHLIEFSLLQVGETSRLGVVLREREKIIQFLLPYCNEKTILVILLRHCNQKSGRPCKLNVYSM